MSLGVPPDLLVATHAAMADETVHARDAFALASAYAGHRVGPGRLAIDHALSARAPLDIVETAILEGCIGETMAAVEAAEAMAHATDPAVREALGRVTVDETRHAELAWRFVQWVLEHGEPTLSEAVRTRLMLVAEREAAASVRGGAENAEDEPVLLAHGVLGERARGEIRKRVLSDVILPCARALGARRTSTLSRDRSFERPLASERRAAARETHPQEMGALMHRLREKASDLFDPIAVAFGA
jgi:hypothetical protein